MYVNWISHWIRKHLTLLKNVFRNVGKFDHTYTHLCAYNIYSNKNTITMAFFYINQQNELIARISYATLILITVFIDLI